MPRISFDDFQTEMNSNMQNCESICDGAMLDKGIDDYTHPCNFTSDNDQEDDDHWDHWDDDDHEQENDLWSILIQDEVFKILNHDSYLIVIF